MIDENTPTMVINTPTLKDYIEVVKWAIDQDMVWQSNKEIVIHEDYWKHYRSETYVVITGKILTYCDIGYVDEYINDYKTDILNMEQFFEMARKNNINNFKRKYDLR